MTASDVQDVALQLIAASNEFSRGDKVCMVVGKNKCVRPLVKTQNI